MKPLNTLSRDDATTILSDALDWLEDNPDNHIRGSLAINADGVTLPPTDPDACAFCFAGRVMKEISDREFERNITFEEALGVVLNKAEKSAGPRSLVITNDNFLAAYGPAETIKRLRKLLGFKRG